jgi:hypothetical protein
MFRDSHKLLRRFLPTPLAARGVEKQDNSDIAAALVTFRDDRLFCVFA